MGIWIPKSTDENNYWKFHAMHETYRTLFKTRKYCNWYALCQQHLWNVLDTEHKLI